ETVERSALVKGYEFAKDQYVRVTDDELKALEGEASKMIDIAEFVPLAKVDPIYFEKTYYLGADKGGEKPYRLLADAMEKSGQVALATFVMRGKESLVLIRAAQGGLMLHTMYFADEVRAFSEVDKGESARIKEGELDLAIKLIDGLAVEDFDPARYKDAYRERVMELLNRKAEGQELTPAPPAAKRRQVIDLMEALKESLATRKPPARVGKKPEPAPARAVAAARKAAGGKK
ncbi:MAG TPA: Ku protein, partial [Methylomirabilota bacterium]|nr:Ku protein [Methylomirabilota bacterium]